MHRATIRNGKLSTLAGLLLTLACLAIVPLTTHAQPTQPVLDENSAGTYYIIAYPDTTANALDSRYPNNRVRSEFSAWIYSAVDNRVKIMSGSGASQVLNLKAGKFEIHTFRGAPSITTINTPSTNTFKLESDFPIIVYCYLATIQGLEAWTPIPVDYWGTEYFAAAVPGEPVLEIGLAQEIAIPHTVKAGSAEILVIAAYDNTRITFRPPPGTDFIDGPRRDITLEAGQAFQVQSIVDPVLAEEGEPQQDIAGTVITSDKPIGVLSGNTRAMVNKDEAGLKNNAYRNMLMEWLTPSEQHGKEFVFMPTWDNLRPGSGAAVERKREFTRVYATQGKDMTGHYLQPGGITPVPFTARVDSFFEASVGTPSAVCFHTDLPSQAMMHSSAIVKFNGSTPCFGGIPCLSYDAWAPYMVEMTPREQWTTFAPYYAPPNPGGMAHYINVVTDTASASAGNVVRKNGARFIFNRKIPGTDLIWGSMSVNPGEDEFLLGKNGAKFSAFVYGIKQGYEEYRPGRTKKKKDDDKHAVASGGGKDKSPMPLHPCEYEEYNAVSYGYPLAPARRVLKPGDSLQIDTLMDCTTLTIKARAINESPVGFRSVTLDPTSVKNAKLVPVDPVKLSDVLGRSRLELRVEPINPLQNAEATVILKDRTGKLWKVYYKYEAEYVTMDPTPELNFGLVTINTERERTVTITNPLARPLEVKQILLAIGSQGYTIVSTDPAGPAKTPAEAITLQPGGKMTVVVRTKPTEENRIYVDTLKVVLGCTKPALPLITETARPIIRVSDIDFGVFIKDDPAKLDSFRICNEGGGVLTFNNPNDPATTALLTWVQTRFTVDPLEISKLKTTQLGQNECVWVKVTFTPDQLGDYREVARVWGSTRYIRDTSVWTAKVVKPGPLLTPYDWKERWVTQKLQANCTKNGTPEYYADVMLSNAGSSDFTVKSIELIDQDAVDGYFRFDDSDPLKDIKVGDNIIAGAPPRVQRVAFAPKDERAYSARVRVVTDRDEEITAELKGIGIESHGEISSITWPDALYQGTADPGRTLYATLRALPTRPLTVTDIVIDGPHAADFTVDRANITFPFTLQPSQTTDIPVIFKPIAAGKRDAFIRFVGDHSLCDDSSNTLTAYTFVLGVVTTDADFGLACGDADNVVTITNNGTEPVEVRNATLNDPDGVFSLPLDVTPILGTLAPGETKTLPVRFDRTKTGAGSHDATVTFDVIDGDGNALAAEPSRITGSRYMLTVGAHIDRTFKGQPGSTVQVPVKLDGDLSANIPNFDRVTTFRMKINYDRRMSRLTNADATRIATMTQGTMLAGWGVNVLSFDQKKGELELELTSPNASTYLAGPGTLLNLEFLLYIGQADSSEVSFSFEFPTNECLMVDPKPGLLRLDSVCGLSYRLIEATTGSDYTLDQNKPNPFNPATKISFSLGLDGPTKLTIYDASGRKVATVIDGYMEPGAYEITWDASGFPSGMYYYRLESGEWTKTNTMMLRK